MIDVQWPSSTQNATIQEPSTVLNDIRRPERTNNETQNPYTCKARKKQLG